jgi:hypothetical protein
MTDLCRGLFSNWWFWDKSDPTNGYVNFLSKDDAWSKGNIYIDGKSNNVGPCGAVEVVDFSSQWLDFLSGCYASKPCKCYLYIQVTHD